MTFIEFMIEHVGPKWVVLSRRTVKMKRRYAGSTLLTRGDYQRLADEYTALTGKRHW